MSETPKQEPRVSLSPLARAEKLLFDPRLEKALSVRELDALLHAFAAEIQAAIAEEVWHRSNVP